MTWILISLDNETRENTYLIKKKKINNFVTKLIVATVMILTIQEFKDKSVIPKKKLWLIAGWLWCLSALIIN